MDHTATLYMCKMISEVSAINWWQPHDHTTLQTFFYARKSKIIMIFYEMEVNIRVHFGSFRGGPKKDVSLNFKVIHRKNYR